VKCLLRGGADIYFTTSADLKTLARPQITQINADVRQTSQRPNQMTLSPGHTELPPGGLYIPHLRHLRIIHEV
jgi:hypothetical protein